MAPRYHEYLDNRSGGQDQLAKGQDGEPRDLGVTTIRALGVVPKTSWVRGQQGRPGTQPFWALGVVPKTSWLEGSLGEPKCPDA